MEIKNDCDGCKKNETKKYEKFNIIDLDIKGFCNKEHKNGNSLTNFDINDLINYYFDENKREEEQFECNICGANKAKLIERKIIELPNYLIIRINWGNFKNKEGFNCEIDYIKPSYQYLEYIEIIEINEDYLNGISFNNDDELIKDSVEYKLFSTIDYYKDTNIFISKYRIKEEGKRNNWYNFWCGEKGKETTTYIDHFTVPCLLFYEKNK